MFYKRGFPKKHRFFEYAILVVLFDDDISRAETLKSLGHGFFCKAKVLRQAQKFHIWSSLIGTKKPPGLVRVDAPQARIGCREHPTRIRTNSAPEALVKYNTLFSFFKYSWDFYFT